MAASSLTPPGSAAYSSGTMYVGDGTWDTQRNTFLLPNLQGLNYETTRYNGMGNRFADMPGYYNLVLAHGILAAITFLLIVPFAILVNRFFVRRPALKLRLHIAAQILTVLLTTVVFFLGYFSVGPQRSFTNPHHTIGLALYVLVLVQFVGGWLMHGRKNRRRKFVHAPLKLVLHQWLGRIVGLLGLAQIPLGLALYGAPLSLFILYALAAFALVVVYFVLDYMRERNFGGRRENGHRYSSASGSVIDEQRHAHFAPGAAATGAGTGLGAWADRFRSRRDTKGTNGPAGSYLDEEKYHEYDQESRKGGGLASKALGLGAFAAVGALIGRLLSRKGDRTRDGTTTESSADALGRVEEGRPMPSAKQPLNPPMSHRRSHSSLSSSSSSSDSPSRRSNRHGVRNAVFGLGAARNFFNLKKRRERKEQQRIDELRRQELEAEQIQREYSERYAGDLLPQRPPRRGSLTTSTSLSPAPVGGAAAMGRPVGPGSDGRPRPPLESSPLAFSSPPRANPMISGQPLPIPPPLPVHDPHQTTQHDSSGSDRYASPAEERFRRRDSFGGAAGFAAGEAMAKQREHAHRRNHSAGTSSMVSPPVSVKLNMHPDGRHVTLRRLTEEEAARERDRKSSRNRHVRRRAGSVGSTLSGAEGGERWRRVEAREMQEQRELERQQLQALQGRPVQQPPSAFSQSSNMVAPIPPPPPIPESDVRRPGTDSIGSPGTYAETEVSTNYAENRRRRRAQRAQATLDKQQQAGRGGGVDFE